MYMYVCVLFCTLLGLTTIEVLWPVGRPTYRRTLLYLWQSAYKFFFLFIKIQMHSNAFYVYVFMFVALFVCMCLIVCCIFFFHLCVLAAISMRTNLFACLTVGQISDKSGDIFGF